MTYIDMKAFHKGLNEKQIHALSRLESKVNFEATENEIVIYDLIIDLLNQNTQLKINFINAVSQMSKANNIVNQALIDFIETIKD